MSPLADNGLRRDDSLSARRTLEAHAPDSGGSSMDREAVLHRRRKSAIRSLMFEVERAIEPHVRPGHERAIADFKTHVRQALNSLTFEAIELMKDAHSGLNGHAVQLAGELAFDHNDGGPEQT